MFLFVLALAADAASAQPQTKAEEADPIVCKQQARTNTRFAKKVCMRKSEADARAKADQRAADEMINRPSINPASGGG
ncbi:MAG: hypothetical protein ABWZ75_11150 [Novosphingobium sp.]